MADSRVVVVTGASAGIGLALSQQLAARGDRIVLAARREQELRELAASLGPEALAVPTDVTRREDVERLRDRAIARFGRVDVWVNNAGRGISRRVLDLTDDEFDVIVAVNVKSALYGMQAIVPHFIEQGRGQIINISSFLSRVPSASVRSVYSASKAALNSLTANARVDLAIEHPGIHVSLVMPGVVSTDFSRNALGGAQPLPPRRGVPAAQTADEVATIIVRVIDKPVAEVYTNPLHAAIAQRYLADVDAFEREQRAP